MTDILQLLHEKNELSTSNLEVLKRYIARWQLTPFEAILETHICSEDRLADKLAEIFQAQRIISIVDADVLHDSFQYLDYQTAKSLACLFLKSEEGGRPILVVADPSQEQFQTFAAKLDFAYQLAIAEKSLIIEALNRCYPIELQLPHLFRINKEDAVK